MSQKITTPFQKAIDVVEMLPLEDQETLIDLIHRRLIERRRAEIARHAAETLQAVREGRAPARCLRCSLTTWVSPAPTCTWA